MIVEGAFPSINLAERIRKEFEQFEFKVQGLKSTLSICLVEGPIESDAESIINQVDKMLYKAKRNGRNRIEY